MKLLPFFHRGASSYRQQASGQLTAAHAAMPGPDRLADVESVIGFFLMKTFSEWGSRFEVQGEAAD